MKNILVTGGGGFIGSHTCLALLEKGYNIVVIDTFENSTPKSIERVLEIYRQRQVKSNKTIDIFEGDLCDMNFLRDVFSKIYKVNKKIDGVIHFAGLKSVAESITNPILYWRTNLMGTINLLSIMNQFNCCNLVFSSSATIYENNDYEILNEYSNISPVNPYGNTKYSIELFLKDFFKYSEKKMKIASLRYFNPIGAHESGLLGEDPKGIPNNIFPLINNTAFGLQRELKIFGKDWPTHDGTPIRDYIHVMDLAEAHLKILEYLKKKDTIFQEVNIGTGKGTSVLDLVKIYENVNNTKVPYVFKNRRSGDVAHLVADNSFAISEFNIIPKRSIEDMCKDGWHWKKLNPKGY